MKYTNVIGLIAVALLCWACTQKWIIIGSDVYYMTGLEHTTKENPFFKPGKMHIFFGALAAIFFLVPKVWAKRINIFVTAINLGWAIRNFFAIGLSCRGGICPTAQLGIYLVFIASIIMFVMSLLPKLNITPAKD